MKFNFFEKKDSKATVNYLELTPSVNYDHVVNSKGLVDVLVPKFTKEWQNRFLIPKGKSPHIRANLDDFGSYTWLLIDGKTKVGDIGEALEQKFGEKVHPVFQRLTLFMTHLYKNGFITFNEFKKGEKYG